MFKNNANQNGAQGVPSVITKTNFFTNNDPNGIADATVFMDVYHPMTPKIKQKYAYLWELLRTGHDINGMLEERTDRDNIPYVWVEVKLLRGVIAFKVVLLSPQMFEFFIRYQSGLASVRFTLQELVAEAEKLDKRPVPELKGF